MKKYKINIFLSLTFTLIALMSNLKMEAQQAEIGLRYMPTFSSLNLNSSSNGTIKGEVTLGFGAGALVAYNFTDHTGIQAEIIYNSLSQKYKDADVERNIELKYINIPLLLSLNTGKTKAVNLNMVVGPQLGLSVGSKISVTSNDGNTNTTGILDVKKSDLGIAYGLGLDFGINHSHTTRLGLGYRGVLGLIDISDKSQSLSNDSYYVLSRTHLKTNAAYIGISFLF